MSVINDFKKMYHEWRRQSLPPSNADIHSRHEVIVRRLDQIEQAITNRFPETVSWPAQQGEILAVLRLLEPKKVVDYKKIRVGSEGGGGYVQIDDLEGISHALAFGVSGNDSWDLAMAKAGIPVEQFDHAIERAPSSHPLLHFHRKVISVDATAETATLSDLVAEHSKPGAPDLILKIDIEGCEWDVFDRATDAVLSRLAQVICEFHDLSHLTAPAFRARARCVFEKLDKHFAPVHPPTSRWRRFDFERRQGEPLGLAAGDEVILPTFTIISCASAILRAGAVPVVVDSDPVTWNMQADTASIAD
jgi:FkbM family methyltransferase